MLPNLSESLIESAKRAPGKAKEKALSTLRDCYDIVKGSDSIKEEIGKQINTAVKTPLEVGGSVLTAGNQLIHRHPIEATKTIANGLIETSKNVAKMGLAPVSGTLTIVKSGINTGKKILGVPSNFAFSVYHSAQKTNEKLFSLSDKFKEWNKLKPEAEAPTEPTPVAGTGTDTAEIGEPTETAEGSEPAETVTEKKVPALMQIPGSEAPQEPVVETEVDEKKPDMPIAA